MISLILLRLLILLVNINMTAWIVLLLLIILFFGAKPESFRALDDGGRHHEDREEVSKRHQKPMCEQRDLIREIIEQNRRLVESNNALKEQIQGRKEYLRSPCRHPQGNEMGARELAIKVRGTEAHVRKVEEENFKLRLEKREIASELRNLLPSEATNGVPQIHRNLRAFAADQDEAGYSYRKKYPDVVMLEMLDIIAELKRGHMEKQHRVKRQREGLESKLENEAIERIQK